MRRLCIEFMRWSAPSQRYYFDNLRIIVLPLGYEEAWPENFAAVESFPSTDVQ
jgi:hypothetical protein